MNQMKVFKTLRTLAALMLAVLLLASCQSMDTGDAKKAEPVGRLPDVREFDDVLVPRDMVVSRDASFVHRGTAMPTGLLRLAGAVEAKSLMRYFQANMPKDGWRLVSEFRGPQTLMAFQKAERMCLIAIEESTFRTYMDIWVVPLNETVDMGPRK